MEVAQNVRGPGETNAERGLMLKIGDRITINAFAETSRMSIALTKSQAKKLGRLWSAHMYFAFEFDEIKEKFILNVINLDTKTGELHVPARLSQTMSSAMQFYSGRMWEGVFRSESGVLELEMTYPYQVGGLRQSKEVADDALRTMYR